MSGKLEFYKKKLDIFKNPQTFTIDNKLDDELVKSIFDNISNMKAKDIIFQFADCGDPHVVNFNFETLSESNINKEIEKTECKIKEYEDCEE